jgi:hypothetical protein
VYGEAQWIATQLTERAAGVLLQAFLGHFPGLNVPRPVGVIPNSRGEWPLGYSGGRRYRLTGVR